MRLLLMLPVTLMLVAAPAAAQTQQNDNPQATQPTDKCRARTDGTKKPDDKTLSETLDNCDGVLKPPATGDQGMTTPPPAEGNTPVIKPGDVPAQPPKQ